MTERNLNKLKCKCENCNHILSPKEADESPFCPQCKHRQSLTKRIDIINSPNGGGTTTLARYKCPQCGCEDAFEFDCAYFKSVHCSECGTEISNSTEGKQKPPINISSKPTVECPYCHSTNTKKISSISKVGSVAVLGIFALGKTTKEWHCNNCKSDF